MQGDASSQCEEPPPEGLGGHGLLTQADAGCPAGQVVGHHLYRQPGAVGGEAARGEVVQPDAECRAIAKSCANYSLRQFSEADYSAIQTQRNAKRWHGKYNYDFEARDASILSLRELGFTQAEIARRALRHERRTTPSRRPTRRPVRLPRIRTRRPRTASFEPDTPETNRTEAP